MGVKQCNKCSVELIAGENIWKSSFNNSDFRCKKCQTHHVNTTAKWRKKGKGVYGIFVGESCYYIGESSQLNNRISAHKTLIRNPIPAKPHFKPLYDALQGKNYEFRILEETDNHKEQEQVWVNYYSPLYNIYR